MSVIVVTGYVPLPCSHRSEPVYLELGARLLAACGRAVAFTQTLGDCWLAKAWRAAGVPVPPGGKDTLAYFAVQHQKSEWLAQAARLHPEATLAWIDYGIFHLGVTADHVRGFLAALEANPPQAITSPSCYPVAATGDDSRVEWSFCGGVLALPARRAEWFHERCVEARASGQPTWEVNTWAAVARRHPDAFRLYAANHNATLFTGYAA